MHRNKRKTATRNAGLFFLLIGLVMTVAIVSDMVATQYQEDRNTQRNQRVRELMLYRALLNRSDYGDSFTIDEPELPWEPGPMGREIW